MAAALFRRGTGLCCIHRELCRLVWRPQTALFSSRPSDRKQPRRTHIKKAKPQPAVDVAKLLEQLFSQNRPGSAPPAARPAKASSVPTKPLATSSMKASTSNVPPLSKTEPAVSAFPAASSINQVDSVPKKTTSAFNAAPLTPQPQSASPTNPETSSETPPQSPLDSIQAFAADVSNVTVSPASTAPASLGSEAAAVGIIVETNVETATELPLSARMAERHIETLSFPAAAVEPLVETTTESPVEPSLSPVETLKGRAEGAVAPTVDEVQTKDSGAVEVSHAAKEEPLIETTIESPVDFPVETLETRAAAVEGPVEPAIDVTVDLAAETTNSGVVNISHTATVEPSLETTVEPSVEARVPSPLETLESRAAVVECPVEPTVDPPAQAVQTNSTDSGPANLPHTAAVEPLIETTVDPSAEASSSPRETLESRAAVAEGSVETRIEAEADTAAQVGQINSSDSGVINVSYSAKEEPLIETTIEPAVEVSTSPLESSAAVCEGTIENEAADNLSHTALIQNARNEVESTIESTVESESGDVAVEERANKPEQMTLESVTLHVVEFEVESLKIDELLQTKSALDEKAENQLQESLVQTETGAGLKAAAETENSSEGESEILTEVLSKWGSLSEDLQEFEGESDTLVKELLCHVPGSVRTSSASDPPAGAHGEQTEEKGTEAEAMTLDSMTLAKVKAEVGGLETEDLLETRNALDKEDEVRAEEEKMEVTTIEDVAIFEVTTEADILALDSISEATDAIEAEASIMMEAMFGSEQGPRQPPDTLLVDQKLGQQGEAFSQDAGGVLEAMTLESVTLAEVEASLGTLEDESLSETSDYLEKEAEIVAGEKRTEVEDEEASEETTEALKIESLSLPEADDLSEALQTDALMEELLFSVPGHVKGVTEGPIGQEAVRVNTLDATAAAGSVDVGTAAAVKDDFPASPALKEELPGQEVEEEEGAETEALGNEDGEGTHADLDPVHRLFLEKIREYENMRRLNGGPSEAEPDYEKYLSEETAKLQRLYGGGDLSSFPEFTFTEPEMDQDSK